MASVNQIVLAVLVCVIYMALSQGFVVDTQECNNAYCNNRGYCTIHHHFGFICHCDDDTTVKGQRCELVCSPDFCNGKGDCEFDGGHHSNLTRLCRCNAGFTGTHCDNNGTTNIVTDPCDQHHVCHHGSSCVVDTSSQRGFRCDCKNGFVGTLCDQHSPCFHNPCPNGGTCNTIMGSTDVFSYNCTCLEGLTGPNCDVVAVTTSLSPPTTLSTTPSPSTTHATVTATQTVEFPHCEVFTVLNALVHKQSAVDPIATACPNTGVRETAEALVLYNCEVSDVDHWRMGVDVAANCQSIPKYTPIAKFVNGVFPKGSSQTGLFVGCDPTGFKVITQNCTNPTQTFLIETSGPNSVTEVYFTVY